MRKTTKSIGLVLFIVICLLLPGITRALEIDEDLKIESDRLSKLEQNRVKRVIDGDTVVLRDDRHLRFIGIDTPETNHRHQEVEYYGKRATDYTRKHLAHKTIYLEYDVETRDQYGRTLAYVFLENGTFFNALLVQDGYARLLTISPNVKYADLFVELVTEAREQGRGLWQQQEDLPVISWKQADNHLGERAIVTGRVVATHDSGKAVFLNFAENYHETFTGVIFSEDKFKFEVEPATYYKNKQVKITGDIKEYKGAPEIIIRGPSQIEIVENQED